MHSHTIDRLHPSADTDITNPPTQKQQVQELKGLHKLRQLVHTHLGGPNEYIMFGQEFGVVGGACMCH